MLQAAGHEVVEVDRPNRQLRRSKGKSDTTDADADADADAEAEAAAQIAAPAGHATSVPKSRDGIVECLRVLRLADRSAKEQMSRLAGQVAHLGGSRPGGNPR